MPYCLPIKVFDFFSGCGGASQGFRQVGMDIVFALDNDLAAAHTFRKNFPETYFLCEDITRMTVEQIRPQIDACQGYPVLFSGCAPCQPFTKQNTRRRSGDKRGTLLQYFKQLVEIYLPELVFVENVPGVQKVNSEGGPFGEFVETLKSRDYAVAHDILASQDYGVPQMRRRLVLIASRLGPLALPPKTHGPGTAHPAYLTVREWIGDLPPIRAGEAHLTVPNHRAMTLSPQNLKRIRAIPEGGDRRSWPEHLRLRCHSEGYNGHTDVYGRMRWDAPASGLTTRCISLSNGRFGHPEQDRAISVREAACLQTFPRNFLFYGSLAAMARQVGNAVPVEMAKVFGEAFVRHCETFSAQGGT